MTLSSKTVKNFEERGTALLDDIVEYGNST